MSSSYNRKDSYYKRAKEEGFRSRAGYKLMELDRRFRLLSGAKKVLDLGSWPGSWLQVLAENLESDSLIVGIDLVEVEDLGFSNIRIITGDVGSDDVKTELATLTEAGFDLILSDMSPKLSGIREADQAGSVRCAELAIDMARQFLRPGGNIVIKVFKGNDVENYIKSIRSNFKKITRVELDSTRNTSNEMYLVGEKFVNPEMES